MSKSSKDGGIRWSSARHKGARFAYDVGTAQEGISSKANLGDYSFTMPGLKNIRKALLLATIAFVLTIPWIFTYEYARKCKTIDELVKLFDRLIVCIDSIKP